MKRLSDIQENNSPFLIVGCKLENDHVYIEDNPVICNTAGERKFFETEQTEYKLWVSGGFAYILNNKYLITSNRGENAPSFINHDNLPLGFSDNIGEHLNPMITIKREGLEEVIIYTPDGFVIPDVFLNTDIVLKTIPIAKTYDKNLKENIIKAESEFLITEDKDITIHYKEKEYKINAILVEEEGRQNINLIKIIKLNIPYDLKDIKIFDGEMTYDNKLINQTINLYDISDFKIKYQYKSGILKESNAENKQTPALQKIIEILKKAA